GPRAGRGAEGEGVVPGPGQHQAGRLVGLAPAQPGEGLTLGGEAGVEVQERGHVGGAEQQRPAILPASHGRGPPVPGDRPSVRTGIVIIYATESPRSGMHREEERVPMSRPRWVAFVALLGAFMLAAAGCANKDNGGGGGQAEASTADTLGFRHVW